MRVLSYILGCALLVACGTLSSSEKSALPDPHSFELPANAAAAEMTQEYFTIMDRKMALAAELGRIHTRDQYVREVFIDMFSDPALDPDVRTAFQEAGGHYVEAIDAVNTAELKVLMQDVSWRELATDEARLANRAFSIVQHSNDDAYREAVLAKIKPLAEEGLMEGQHYALMYDRVMLKKGKPQLYGSQTDCENGQYEVINLAEPETVDTRRAAMGMEPLADYVARNREYYGPCQ